MIIAIFGTNGMISSLLSKFFYDKSETNIVNVYGTQEPGNYLFSNFFYTDLLKDGIDYQELLKSDLIIYAAGAGVQASIIESSELMYQLNLFVPISICTQLKVLNYKGIFVSFGSYMEIGLNNDETILFDEKQIEFSSLKVTNDYAISKRLLTRFMGSFSAPYHFLHLILPNIYSNNETGTRLIPYVLNYLSKIKNGLHCNVPQFSSGNQVRQFVNFEDVCFALTRCIKCNIQSGIYNLGGGEILSIKELIIRLFNYYQIPVKDEMFGKEATRDSDIKYLKLNGNKLMKEIDYLPHQRIESILGNI